MTVFDNSGVKYSPSATGVKSEYRFMLHTAYRLFTYNTVTRIVSAASAGSCNRPGYKHYRVPLELNSLIVFSAKRRPENTFKGDTFSSKLEDLGTLVTFYSA